MLIKNWDFAEQENTWEVSADIDGFRLWYRVPKTYAVSRSGDPFLAVALLPAMLKGEGLEMDPGLPVSPKLLGNAYLLQEIHHSWNPVLKRISIQARTEPALPVNAGAFSFFSGGVDSMFTFLKRRQDISHAVFIHGFDFFLDQRDFQTAVARNAAFVQDFGKTLIPIETNYHPFSYRYNLSRSLTQGGGLSSIALLLGFSRVYVPASDHYSHLAPLGSHPLTDPLYSNECVEIIHDGVEARRVDKVIAIAEYASALANLTVCYNDMNKNCGTCIKCLRTMIPLSALKIGSAPFPPLPPLKVIRRVDWSHEPNFLKQNIELALRTGHRELADTLSACQRKYDRRQIINDVDRILLGGIFNRACRRLSKTPAEARRIKATPPKD